ncbi:MAG: aminopeptidase P N-terminal domain-containing protein [Candidatus Nomurabacteria bacterium]|nr:MAG: aminopeptidase P N-terminal domain-containing protein [Candidatus Nomurabacteria bacterium]
MTALDKSFFTGNRERVYDELKGGILAVPAYTQMQRGNDAAAHFEQEGNFWYLTGVEHPDWWLLMDAKRRRSWLVAPTVEQHHEIFDGSLSPEDAKKISGVDEIIDRQEADSWLRQVARSHRLVHTVDAPSGADRFGFTLNPAAHEMHDKLERIFTSVSDFRLELARLRAVKQLVEIAVMQSAIDLTVKSFADVKKKIDSYKYEYEVEADFTYDFRKSGAQGHAYDPIVAFGKNACTLHYIHNNDKLNKGKLLLIDIGARQNGYAADITRTYAVGKPTKRQQAVHDAVREAQKQIIELIEPGLQAEAYFNKVDNIMQEALISLGLIRDASDPDYRKYFPHSIGHGLGIDVHDALGRPDAFKPGMVMTVEPGIYIPEEGIGVRIEDDILITDNGYKNLSAKLSTDL